MEPQQPNTGPPAYPPQPGNTPDGSMPPGQLPGPVPPTRQAGSSAPNVYTTQLPQGSRYVTPLDAQPGVPVAPVTAQYDFIVDNGRPVKKGLFGRPSPIGAPSNGGSGFIKRLLIGIVGFAILAAVILTGISYYISSKSSSAQDMLHIAADQTEIIRIANIGMKQARSTEAQVLASTTRYSLQSDLNNSLLALKKHHLKVTAASLATSKNTKADTLLSVASQNNRFDEEYLNIIHTMLVSYQLKVKTAYDASKDTFDKQSLAASYDHINTILGQPTVSNPAPAATDVSPTPTPGPVAQ